ncbi:MAG: Mannosylglycerate hydrolase [Firmicutes bacterium]|nr:Mannosylglycerate hydrolase [Bacillota bacterium]
MDNLIAFMEANPEYKYFHLDSQTVIVEDYLRVRPENRERLLDLIKKGRILVGPYYSLLEMSHVLGESIIRNFLVGNKLAENFGGRMDIGYSPTGCGQISQMPQLLQSVGLDTIVFYRGLRQNRSRLEFIWQGSDGSEVLGLRLTGPMGRAWFFAKVCVPVLFPKGVLQDGIMALHNDLFNPGSYRIPYHKFPRRSMSDMKQNSHALRKCSRRTDGVHNMVPREKQKESARKLRDTYAMVPNALFLSVSLAIIAWNDGKSKACHKIFRFGNFSIMTLPATTTLANSVGAKRRLSQSSRRKFWRTEVSMRLFRISPGEKCSTSKDEETDSCRNISIIPSKTWKHGRKKLSGALMPGTTSDITT